MKLGKFIEINNLTIKTISNATGISVQTIYKYSKGIARPSIKNAVILNKVTLGAVSFEDLQSLKKEPLD